MRTRDRRLGRVRRNLDASPVRRDVLREAYEWFTSFGELTDDDRVAYEVVQRALRGGVEAPLDEEVVIDRRVRRARAAYHERGRPAAQWPPSVRALLFDEALFEVEPMRRLARAAIAVEGEAFAARYAIPYYGTVAMHMHGWERRLILPPYGDQAKRLFVCIDNLRGRMPSDDATWFGQVANAIARLRTDGELPVDDVLAEALLTQVEMDLLRAPRRGKDVKDALRVLEQIAGRMSWCGAGECRRRASRRSMPPR